jgi:predicted AAA+ superfamily ATPase
VERKTRQETADPEHDILIMDEIQYCPKALTSLKYFNVSMPGFAICSAGSLLGIQLLTSSFPVS